MHTTALSNHRRVWPALLLSSSLAVSPLLGQTSGTSTGSSAETPSSSASASSDRSAGSRAPLSRDDRDFVRQAATINYQEVAVSQIALKQASSDRVRQYAQMMVDEHGQASQKLVQLAQQRGVDIRVAGPGTLDNPVVPEADAPPTVPAPGSPIPAPQNQPYGGIGGAMGSAMGTVADAADRGMTAADVAELREAEGREFDERYAELMVSSHQTALERFERAVDDLDDPALRAFAQQQLPALRHHLQAAQQLRDAVAE